MTWDTALPIVAGALAGGFVNGLAGFGTALFALGFFLVVLTPPEAVALTVFLSVASGLQGVWIVRHTIRAERRRLARFLLPGLVGIPAGIALLSLLDARGLTLVVAFFLVLYGGYFSLRRALPQVAGERPLADMAVGLAGGVLGGAASLSGALPTMWCSVRPWPKAEIRAVLQPYNVVILGLTAAALALRGAYTPPVLAAMVLALPAAMIAAQLGIMAFRRLADAAFRRLLVVLTLVSGSVLAVRALA